MNRFYPFGSDTCTMKRRRYLLLAAGLTGLAGCSGVLDDESDTVEPTEVSERFATTTTREPETTETTRTTAETATGEPAGAPETATETTGTTETTETATETETTTRTTTESTPRPGALEIAEVDYSEQSSDDGVARVDVANPTDRDHGYAEVEVRFLDGNGDAVSTPDANIRAVLGGDTWRAYEEYHDDEPVEDVEAVFEDRSETLEHVPPDGAEVTESELAGDVFGDPVVEGTIRTTAEFDYLEAVCTFYDEDGYLRTAGRTNETDVAADATWEFEVDASLGDFGAEISDYEILLTVD